MPLKRFGVSLEDNLLESLDQYVSENGFANRSQAIRFLVEKNVAEKKWQCNHIVAGTTHGNTKSTRLITYSIDRQ